MEALFLTSASSLLTFNLLRIKRHSLEGIEKKHPGGYVLRKSNFRRKLGIFKQSLSAETKTKESAPGSRL